MFNAKILGLATISTTMLGLGLGSIAPAQAALITFDAGDPIGGLAAGTILSNQYAGIGVTFSPNAFGGFGGPTGAWATNTGMRIGTDFGGIGTPVLNSGNGLHLLSDWTGENGDPSFRATFSSPISSLSAVFFGIFTPASTRLFAYDSLGGLLATATAPTPTQGQSLLTVSSSSPIASVVFTPGDFVDWVGVDNIEFTPAQPIPTPMLLPGLIGMGVAALRQRRRLVEKSTEGES